MVQTLTYRKNTIILEVWGTVQKIENYHERIGTSMFQKFFSKCPKAKVLFGHPIDIDVYSKELLEDKSFRAQGTLYVQLLDTVFDMLGPDIELLTEILEELGEKHWKVYGVTHDMYGPMGEALLETLALFLGRQCTPEIVGIALDIWTDLSKDMTRRQLQHLAAPKNQPCTVAALPIPIKRIPETPVARRITN